MSDPELDQLRKAVDRALRNHQYRVSVSPGAVRVALRERDDALARLEKIEGKKEPGVEHKHRDPQQPSREIVHLHLRGEIPHGHHGLRYAGVVKARDKVTETFDPRPRIQI